MTGLRKAWWLHPFLVGCYPIFFLFSRNVDEVTFQDIVFPAQVVLAATLILLAVFRMVFGDKEKAAVMTSVFFILFFSFGHVRQHLPFLQPYFNPLNPLFRYLAWLGTLCVLPFLVISIIIKAKKTSLKTITEGMNLIAIVFLVLAIIPIVQFQYKIHALQQEIGQGPQERMPPAIKSDKKRPDIYYFIFDGYGGQKALESFYGYSNEPFLSALKSRGLFVANKSRSNYAFTMRSIPSSLNMDYIENLNDKAKEDVALGFTIGRQLIQENQVMKMLKDRGYRYYHFGSSGFPPTKINVNADRNISIEKYDEFTRMLLKTTALGPTQSVLTAPDRRSNILHIFDELEKVARDKEGPIFAFAHFIIPHPPYVFDEDGSSYSLVELATQEGQKRPEHYVKQLQFTNKKIIHFIDRVLAASDTPPIIIMHGDHGPRPEWRGAKSYEVDRKDPMAFRGYLKEIVNIFMAVYAPEEAATNFYDAMTPVNLIRPIFNHLFETDFERLEDKTYIPDESGTGISEVTSEVKQALESTP